MPNRIVFKRQWAEDIFEIKVEAPLIAEERRAGQFVILQLNDEYGERIPLTIADADRTAGTITLIFQTVGKTSHALADLDVGDYIAHMVGPLGHPTHIERVGTVVGVGGGIGAAPLYPIAEAMKAAGNRLIVILGARQAGLMILEDRLAGLADELIVCTDDGSRGRKALVTGPLKEVCERPSKPDLVVAIGPPVMMKACAETTRPYGVRTIVSLNTIMVDGTGMCGGCRVTVDGQTRFVCVDGPEFDGHQVDFDNMIRRLGAYRRQENAAHERCHLEEAIRQKEREAGR